jgi:hypothetical protein
MKAKMKNKLWGNIYITERNIKSGTHGKIVIGRRGEIHKEKLQKND